MQSVSNQGDALAQDRRNSHGNKMVSPTEETSPKKGKQKICMQRPNRTFFRTTTNLNHARCYGTPIRIPKQQSSLRIMFQNIKGLSHFSHGEDYDYYLSHFRDLQIDIAGLAETNTAWKHQYLRQNFNSRARKAGDGLAKTSYGSPDSMIEDIPPNETFQAGGNLTTCIGIWTTTI